ncbi:MAG: hypothetical protein BalsKO_22450 [Balneolaceae bacterium]
MLVKSPIQAQYVSTLADLNAGTLGDGITLASSGDIFYSSGFGFTYNKIYRITQDGEISVYKDNISNPVGIISDSLLNLYVNTYQGNAVRKVDTSGVVTTIATGLNGPAGITRNKAGELFISEYGAGFSGTGNRIMKITVEGKLETFVSSSFFNGLIGLTIDEDGNLYTTNWNNGEVFKISPEQEISLLATIGGNVNQIAYSNGYVLVPSPSKNIIYRVNSETGEIESIAGSGKEGNRDGVSVFANLARPNGITATVSGDTLYFNDGGIVKRITSINEPEIKLEGEHIKEEIQLKVESSKSYDSLQIYIDEELVKTFYSTTIEDTIFNIEYSPEEIIKATIYAIGYSADKVTASSKLVAFLLKFDSPVDSYYTDFDNNPQNDFIFEGFSFQRSTSSFRDYKAHTSHDYLENLEYILTLKSPIKVKPDSSLFMYKDVAIVEPGVEGSVFGDVDFKDYVIVEGSNGNGWVPLIDGYDARYDNSWVGNWPSTVYSEDQFRPHIIDLLDFFSAGDSIIIRFRLFSDNSEAGYGWVLSEIDIQSNLLTNAEEENEALQSFKLEQNYPNPFNPTTTINYFLRESGKTKLTVFDITGREVATLVNELKSRGEHSIQFEASLLSSGLYFYRISTESGFSKTNKMLLIK